MTAPEIWLVLTVGVDLRGYFLGGFNLFELAHKNLFGFFHLYNIDHLLLCSKNLYVPSAAALLHRDCAISLSIILVTNLQIIAKQETMENFVFPDKSYFLSKLQWQ